MLAFLFISLIAPTTCASTLARATCVRDEASLPGRGDVGARCAAANVIAEAEEYSTFCDDAAGAPCRCCRRLRRDAEAGRADARARDRCRGARAAPTKGLAVYTVSTGGYDVDAARLNGTAPEAGVDFLFFCDAASCPAVEALGAATPWTAAPLPPVWRNASKARRRRRPGAPLDDCVGRSFGGFASGAQCLSRDVKLRPHRYLPGYAASLYVDANVRVERRAGNGRRAGTSELSRSATSKSIRLILGRIDGSRRTFEAELKGLRRNGRVGDLSSTQVERPVSPLFAAFRAADLATFVFPRSLAGEADYVVRYLRRRLGLRDEAHAAALRRRVDAQARAYGAAGETAYGKVVLRRHGFAACYFNERWWRELYAGVPRDQLSLLFAAGAAEARAGLARAALNGGPGEARCRCAADDATFQRYFGHAGPTSHLGANWKGRGGPGRRAR